MSKSYFVDKTGRIYGEIEHTNLTDRTAIPSGHAILTDDMIDRIGLAAEIDDKITDAAEKMDEVCVKLDLTQDNDVTPIDPIEIRK